jgi:hypothetical protein
LYFRFPSLPRIFLFFVVFFSVVSLFHGTEFGYKHWFVVCLLKRVFSVSITTANINLPQVLRDLFTHKPRIANTFIYLFIIIITATTTAATTTSLGMTFDADGNEDFCAEQ